MLKTKVIWCESRINIKGSSESISEFADNVKSSYIMFGESVNRPLDFNNIISLGDNSSSENKFKLWGTRWNLREDTEVNLSDNELNYKFKTPWTPPTNVFKKLIQSNPELSFECSYFVPNDIFAGRINGKEGIVIEEEEIINNKEEYMNLVNSSS